MKRKSMITMLVIALMLVLSLTVLSACGKNKDDPPAKYSVTVTNGTGGGEYAEGATVTITANAPATGKEFTSWTLEGVTVENTSVDELTFTMPAGNVTATANYDFIDYTVTVTGGTANKTTAHYGDSITITAAAPETGKEFTSWTIEGVTVDDKTKAEITFTMPANAVTATANYGDVLYEFALENCTADKETAKFGEEVTFTADEIIGKRFDSWNIKGVDDLTGLDLTKSPLTITMPANDINVAAVLEDIDYTVTVTGGTAQVNGGVASASVKAHYGEEVTITAEIPTGMSFAGWTLEGVTVNDKTKAELTFTMPANAVTATANYEYIDYNIKVTGGKAKVNGGVASASVKAHYGDSISIMAEIPTGMIFKGWTLKGVTAETSGFISSFTMPANDVTAKANYVYNNYKVTVNGGTADKTTAHYGEQVTITANEPGTNKEFIGWNSPDGVVFNNNTSIETTFIMSASNVTVNAVFGDINKYSVLVNYGTSGTSEAQTAYCGDPVTITAKNIEGKIFVRWEITGLDTEGLDLTKSPLTFTMPENNVTANAIYEDLITLTFEGSTAQSEPLTYRKGASKTFRIELGDSQELCEYDISLTNKSCTFKVYDSIGNEIEPTDNGDGSMRIAVTRQDTYTIRVTYEGTSSSSQCTIKITASSPTV